MLVFSLFFIVREKFSVPEEPLQRKGNAFSSKLLESYAQYYFYAHEIYGKNMNPADLKIMTQRENHPISWLQYAFLMKIFGNDKEAFSGFDVFKKEAQKTHEIDDRDIATLSRIFYGEISKDELPSAVQTMETLQFGWFQHIYSLVMYRSLGMEEKAEYVRELALHEAYGTVKKIFSVATVLFLSFIAGIVIFIVYVRHGRIFRSFDKYRHYKLKASYLFETFILWLFIATLLKLVLTNSGNVAKMIKSLDLMFRLWFMIALYILPCVSLLYLRGKIIHAQCRREEFYGARGNLLKDVAYGAGGYLASIPLLILSVIIIIPFERIFGKYFTTPSNPAVGLVISTKTAGEWILLFFLICCIAPVIEEVVFRGVLQNAIKRKVGPAAGILLSACFFSLMHPQLPLGLLPLMVLGTVFGILAEARKSIVPSIVAHGMNNGIIVAFMSLFT